MSNVMYEIFQEFERNDIKYLHFKSNTALKSSFDGRGDFDVLVDSSRVSEIEHIISTHNGKRFNPSRLGRYPGVDNWMIFDENSGILYHLHLHYQLATGKALVKDYIIPWKDVLFDTRIKDSTYDIYITDPSLEILLLLSRTVVKSTWKQRLKARFGKFYMPKSMKEEFKDLKSRFSSDAFYVFAEKCSLSKADADVFAGVIEKGTIDAKSFKRLSRVVRRYLKPYRRMSGFAASVLSFYYSFRRTAATVIKNRTEKTRMIKKIHDTNGLIVAFIGVDGAGKSTVTKEIYKWLNKKIECKRFYMGSGDGRIPLSTRILNGFKKSKSKKNPNSDHKVVKIQTVSLFKNPVKYYRRVFKMRALYDVQKKNYKNICRMQRYRLNGGISLLDRYPQIEYSGMNDGPKIVEYRDTFASKRWIDRMIRKENKKLGIVKKIKPDIIFRLNITAETSMSRKPEQKNIDLFRRKIEDLNKISFQGARIIDINAEQPYESELLEIKKILWSLM